MKKITFLQQLALTFTLSLFAFNSFATSITIVASGTTFTPPAITITEGDTVCFQGIGATHPLVFDNDSNTQHVVDNICFIAGDAILPIGTNNYFCFFHVGLGMTGVIVVDALPQHTLTLNLTAFDPHIGNKFEMRVVDKASSMEIGSITVDSIVAAGFSVQLFGIKATRNYWIDFYADLNGNGVYDAPPADHAWQLEVDNVLGDTTFNFTHNTAFTDINWPTGISEPKVKVVSSVAYPNPFNDKTVLSIPANSTERVSIYNMMGRKMKSYQVPANELRIELDLSDFPAGIYFYSLMNKGEAIETKKIVKIKL